MLNDTASKNEKSRSEVTEEKKEKRNREGIIDNELVRMVKEENQEKYAEIIERYRGKLFAYLYRLIGEKEEAEDLLQDVFIKAYRNLSSYDANRRFSSWIYRIAHNEAVNHIKKKSLRKFIPIDNIVSTKDKLNFSSNEEDAQTSWIRKETNKELDDAINKLPLKYKQVLVLRYYSDKSYEEIGEILGKPVNTIGTLIKRAKNRLSLELSNPNSRGLGD